MIAIDRDFVGADLSAQLTEVGVAAAVVVQADPSPAETAFLLDQASATGELRGVVGWLDLQGDVTGQVSSLRSRTGAELLCGIRHTVHLDPDRAWLDRPAARAGIRAVGLAGLTFDLVVLPEQLAAATRLVAAIPETTFVLDHLGKPPIASGELDDWERDLRALARHRNVVAKLSGITIESDWTSWTPADLRPVVDVALDAFGAERAMFGSDWPLVRLTAGGYAGWLDAYLELTDGLSPDEQNAIDRRTAVRTYGLDASGSSSAAPLD
jgi:L-fuconolactonase